MLNVIKADLYRAFKGKGIYITFAMLFIFIVAQVAAGSVGRIGVNTDLNTLTGGFTGSTAVFATMNAVDNYLYFILPLVVIIAAADFSEGTVKNVLAGGMSRTKLFFSKQILCFAFAFLILIINVILSILTATIVNGFGGEFNADFIFKLLKVFIPQLVIFLSVVSVMLFLTFATKKTSALIGCFFAFTMVPLLIIYLLSLFWDGALNLLNYELISMMRNISAVETVTPSLLLRAYITGILFFAASTAGSVIIFKRSEIK